MKLLVNTELSGRLRITAFPCEVSSQKCRYVLYLIEATE